MLAGNAIDLFRLIIETECVSGTFDRVCVSASSVFGFLSKFEHRAPIFSLRIYYISSTCRDQAQEFHSMRAKS